MTNFWLLLLFVGLIVCLLVNKKLQRRIEALERWRQLITQHAASAVPEQEYVWSRETDRR